ncbi:thiol reductant ABC exporter subunit CydD [Pseudonocardia adelaidensis]|uniref:Thiol reductant ABC exporter subunit CydD n=1 Tax=Pseudonocardia adelaidensis TaxID=648754 RepID=A0ABP9N9P2_9PSEU
MTALGRRLLWHAPAIRGFVGLSAGIGVATALLVITQAGLLAEAIAAAFLDGAGLADLAVPLVALACVVLARAALGWAGEVAAQRAAAAVVAQLRATLLDHVLRLGPRHPELPSVGQLATLASRGVDGLDGYVGRYLPQVVVGAVVPLVVGVRILTADWVSALLVGVTVPLIPLFMVLIGLHTKARTARQWRALAVLGHHFLDVVAGLDVLIAFGRARRQGQQIAAMSERYRLETMRGLRVAFLSSLALELLATLSVALVAVSVGLRLVAGQLDLATGLLVIVLAPEVYLPLRAVAARFHDSAEGAAAAGDVFAVLDVPADRPANALPAPDPTAGPVRLNAVGVDGRAGRVLDAVSITIAPGEVLGLTGPSGAGKSTLLDLLLGWRRPDRGAVTVDGVDLGDVDRDAWLRRVAWVPQRPVLIAGTVGDNVRLGAPHATDAELTAVAATAALDLPLDTPVHERGQGLSTGQQRRVALARALLADRPLLLLDEPTEGVDADTEVAVLAALPAALAGRTAVVVSHRSAVLGLTDRVIALPGCPAPPALPHPAPVPGPPETAPDHPPDPTIAAHRTPDASRGDLRALLAVVRPDRGRLAAAVLAGSGSLGCAVALTATSAWLISAAALQPPVLTLMVAIVAVRTFGLAKGIFRYAERLASHDAALRLLATLRVRVWEALVRLGPAVSGRLRSGELLARMVGDVDAQQDVLVRALVPAASAAVVGLGTATALGVLLPSAGVVLAAGLVCAGILAPALTVSLARRAARRTAAARGAVVGAVVELLDGGPDLLAFGAADGRRRTVAALDHRLLALHRRAAGATGLGVALTVLAVGGATVCCTALGVAALRAGVLPGTALAVLALTPLATAELVAALPDAAQRLVTALPAARRLAELERVPAAVSEPDDPRPLPPGQRLDTHGLAVRWPGSDRDAVAGVDLRLPAGGRLVLTGPTGCGKSTVLAALLRTIEPRAGVVRIDGIDTREVLGDELRARIAWCDPAAHLFDSTLRQNLLLARPDAPKDEIVDALCRAGLGDWLAGLPEGLETPVGRHGGAVSGGERQRIGLARALLADRPVLLLDEPTAHLDAGTAALVCADLLRVTAGRTALVVTHRPEELPGLPRMCLPAAVRRLS